MTYLIHLSPGQQYSGVIRVEYGNSGLISVIENLTDIDNETELVKRLGRIPLHQQHIQHLKAKGVKITEVPPDLSFEAFWTRYRYKVGKKARAEQLWNNLNQPDRTAALSGIIEYDRWLERAKVAKAYPETYLSGRRWENDFKGTINLFS